MCGDQCDSNCEPCEDNAYGSSESEIDGAPSEDLDSGSESIGMEDLASVVCGRVFVTWGWWWWGWGRGEGGGGTPPRKRTKNVYLV